MIGEIKTSAEEWDARMFALATFWGDCSKDPRRRVGAVVATKDRRQFSPGYNGFPQGTPDVKTHLMDDEIRLQLMVHAEANALIKAPFDVKGCDLYVTKFPCHVCAGLIANAYISRLVSPPPDLDHATWGESYKLAKEILMNAGVEINVLPVSIPIGGE